MAAGVESRTAGQRRATGSRRARDRALGLQHDLPYFDEQVHFPDFRIEYEVRGREEHEDVEIVTQHYRGAHAASVARAGFRCYGGRASRGGHPFDPGGADDFL